MLLMSVIVMSMQCVRRSFERRTGRKRGFGSDDRCREISDRNQKGEKRTEQRNPHEVTLRPA
jgi:hypothetical protein